MQGEMCHGKAWFFVGDTIPGTSSNYRREDTSSTFMAVEMAKESLRNPVYDFLSCSAS